MSSPSSIITPQIMLTYDIRRNISEEEFTKLLATNIIQAVILYDSGQKADEAAFQKVAEIFVPLIQQHNIAAIIADNSQLSGRVKADGLHMEEQSSKTLVELADMRGKYGTRRILGYGDPHNRHNALQAGEGQPDYIFFGKLGKDKKPAAHPRNLSLGSWWAEVVKLDCVVQAGNSLQSLEAVAATKADFVALEEAIFATTNPTEALLQAEQVLKTL